MKISLSWIKEYIDIDVSPIEVSDALTSLGLECNIISDRLTFTDVVLGKIESYSSHPNSNHLNICSVNIGNEENTFYSYFNYTVFKCLCKKTKNCNRNSRGSNAL